MATEGLAVGEIEGRRWHTLLWRPLGAVAGRAAAGTGQPQGSVCRNSTLPLADSISAFPLGHLRCWQHRFVHRSNLPKCFSALSICIFCSVVQLNKQKMAIVHHQVPYSYKDFPFNIGEKWFEKKILKMQYSNNKIKYCMRTPLMKFSTETRGFFCCFFFFNQPFLP